MTPHTAGRRVTRWILRGLLLAVLLVVALSVSVLVLVPRATHGVAMDVLTGSMTPGIPVGSVVVDRPVDTGALRLGDIATYQVQPGKPVFVTHRIVGINQQTTPETFIFKGDANRGADLRPVPATAIRGKVWFHLPYLGALRDALRSPTSVKKYALMLLAGYALFQAVAALKQRGGHASAGTGGTVGDEDRAIDNVTAQIAGPPSVELQVASRTTVIGR